MLYVQPGTSLTSYKKVWIEAVEVSFHRQWNPDRRSVNAKDRERIRLEIADRFHAILTDELQQKCGYEVVVGRHERATREPGNHQSLHHRSGHDGRGPARTYITSRAK